MPRYKLQSGKHYLMRRGKLRRYVAGDIIEAEEWEVNGFTDSETRFVPLDPPEPVIVADSMRIKHKGAGWYDVINPATGEKLNDAGLRKEDAEAMVGQKEESTA